jgi:hypothetical protein
MGGLMFVGHQNGGSVFVFDLNRADSSFRFIGEYRTSYAETAGMEFDRSTGVLYVWHDDNFDILESLSLASTSIAGESARRFTTLRIFDGPDHSNNEGIALMPISDCKDGVRSLFMTVDGGGSSSLRWYRQFSDGCPLPERPPAAPANLHRTDTR